MKLIDKLREEKDARNFRKVYEKVYKEARKKGGKAWYDFKYVYPRYSPEISEPEEDSEESGNLIFGENTFLNTRGWGYNRNVYISGDDPKNVQSIVKSNLLQFNTSYVVMDNSNGDLYHEFKDAFTRHGYRVKVINTMDVSQSCTYNPFCYMSYCSPEDPVSCIIEEKISEMDDAFKKAVYHFVSMIFDYVLNNFAPEERNLEKMWKILQTENFLENLDEIIDDRNFYKESVVEECTEEVVSFARKIMEEFHTEKYRKLFAAEDTTRLGELGERKQIIFVISDYKNYADRALIKLLCAQYEYGMNFSGGDSYWVLRKGKYTALKSRQVEREDEKIPIEEYEHNLEEAKREIEAEKMRYQNIKYSDNLAEKEQNGCKAKYYILDAETEEILQEFPTAQERNLFMYVIKYGELQEDGFPSRYVQVTFMLLDFLALGKTFTYCSQSDMHSTDYILRFSHFCNAGFMLFVPPCEKVKEVYKKEWNPCLDGCSSWVFLGQKSYEEARLVLGDDDLEGVELTDDLCIVHVPGGNTIVDKVYPLEKHRNFHEI